MRFVEDGEDENVQLNFFCARQGDAWRVYFRPGWLPRSLQHLVDEQGEAYPVYLDFDELARQMKLSEASYAQRISSVGGVELTASGHSARVLASWLGRAFGSSIQLRGGDDEGALETPTGSSR